MNFNSNSQLIKTILCLALYFSVALPTSVLADEQNYGGIIHMKNSLYTTIYVHKSDSVITLKFGKQKSAQSQVDVENLRSHLSDYTAMSFCGLLYNSAPNNILVVGLGGGVIPREMRYYFPQAKIDIVEIDQEIPPIASKYFKFQPDENMKVYISDGRIFIKKFKRMEPIQKYNYIVLDAFTSDYIPFHLMTREFLEELKEILTDDGVIVANVWYPNQLFEAEFKTFLSVFDQSQVYCGNGNAIIVAPGPDCPAITSQQAMQKTSTLQNKLQLSFNLIQIAAMLAPNAKPHPLTQLLTDDCAPVNQLRKLNTP